MSLEENVSNPIVARHYAYLFVLALATFAIGIISGNLNETSILKAIFDILDRIIFIVYTFFIYKLSSLNRSYRICFYLRLVVFFSSFLSLLIPSNTLESIVTGAIVITFLLLAIDIACAYFEFKGHRLAALEKDENLAHKWKLLWYFYVLSFVVMIVGISILVATLFGGGDLYNFVNLFGIITLISTITLLVVSIFEIIYLYKMSKLYA